MMQNLITQILPKGPTTRDKVFLAEKLMKEMPQEVKREIKVEHDFSLGVYARIMYCPADTIFVGKLHKYPQINLLRQGELSVLIGNEVKRIKAPFAFGAPAGSKRIGYVHRDVVWVTIHGTYLKDVDEIEKFFIAQDEKEYLDFMRNEKLLR
jgi:hypothetical protein